MRPIRFSIARLMAVVLAMALGFGALRTASARALGITLTATWAMLGIAIVGAICRRGAERAFWLGFAVCGWVYIDCPAHHVPAWPQLPTRGLLEALGRVMRIPIDPAAPGRFGVDPWKQSFLGIGDCLWSLVFASLGGWLARFLFGTGRDPSPEIGAGIPPPDATPLWWWLRPSMLFISGIAIVMALAIVGARLTPGLWAGLTFFTTCVLLGVAAVAGMCERGKRREALLGGAAFGTGFLLLALARSGDSVWPVLPTSQLLEQARPRLPLGSHAFFTGSETTRAANARIRRALEKPMRLSSEEQTGVDGIVASLKQATVGPGGKSVPIYVDPLGLAEAGAIGETVRPIECDGAPAQLTLRLCLAQLGLAYVVRDGLIEVTSPGIAAYLTRSARADAYQVAGHCVLALIAAGFGGLAAPVVCELTRKSTA